MRPVQHGPAHPPAHHPAASPRPSLPFKPLPPRPQAGAGAGTDSSAAGHGAEGDACRSVVPRHRRDGGGGGMEASAGAVANEGALADLDHCADALAGLGADDGVFSVTLADGRTLDVALQNEAGSLHFLLSSADTCLTRQLKRRRMELQRGVQRRMSGTVTLTVL